MVGLMVVQRDKHWVARKVVQMAGKLVDKKVVQ